MKKLFLKSILYSFLFLLSLEVLVRIFHLAKDNPTRHLDEYKVEKWQPNQQGFSVTGNRKQNFAEYRINQSGYNSYREFLPTKDKIEIAIVGDSFIEGFHQDYYNSIGKKIEKNLSKTEVYEYGYAGYDMADQLHLIHQYERQFDLIDHVVISLTYASDLTRNTYEVVQDRLALESPLNRLFKKSKLLVYSKSIGVFDPLKKLITRLKNFVQFKSQNETKNPNQISTPKNDMNIIYLNNFKNLVTTYGYDKNRFTLLLDARTTSPMFLSFLEENNYSYIDYSQAFEASNHPTSLIYDQHWNDHGREIIAYQISKYLKEKIN